MNDPSPSGVHSTSRGSRTSGSTIWSVVEVVSEATTLVAVASSPPLNSWNSRAMTMTPNSKPPMAMTALTPAVACTAGLGAAGSGPWDSRAPHSSQWRLVGAFWAPQDGQTTGSRYAGGGGGWPGSNRSESSSYAWSSSYPM